MKLKGKRSKIIGKEMILRKSEYLHIQGKKVECVADTSRRMWLQSNKSETVYRTKRRN